MKDLKKLIRFLIKEDEKNPHTKEVLLTEPDVLEGEEETEVSSGGVAGVSVPLGAGPNHPLPTRRPPGMRSPSEVAAASFGGSKIRRKKKKK